MQGILYISHGSRIPGAISEAIHCVRSVQKQVDIGLQEICFLELAEPTVEQGIAALVNQGATKIAIVPMLLLSAGHYYQDIPEEVSRVQSKYNHITFTYGKPLGVQDRMIDILMDRINETNIPVNVDAKILLVGRGSTHAQTKTDIQKIAALLQQKGKLNDVDTCFLTACDPPFEEALDLALKEHHSQVFIVPYLWFTGVLLGNMEEKIANIHSATKQVILCRQLGDHPNIQTVLKERVYEAI